MNKLQTIRENFSTEAKYMSYLVSLKWSKGYTCPKGGHDEYKKGRTQYYRRCKSCFYDESCTSGTLFHKIKFSLVSAFEIIYLLTETKKRMSTVELAHDFGINQGTTWKFKKKIQLAISSGSSSKITGSKISSASLLSFKKPFH